MYNHELTPNQDASRTGYAEAKYHCGSDYCNPQDDASRTGYAEAK